jgi:predicted nucleotidyltransferase
MQPARAGANQRQFERLLAALVEVCTRHYGARLRAIAVFGSVGRGTPRPDSDVDVLIVATGLPDGRVARMDEFRLVEAGLSGALAAAREAGVRTEVSPVLKTPEELAHGTPLLLDMTEDARVLVDRGDLLAGVLAAWRARMAVRGARRTRRGNAWFWDLKPDYRPGEVFEW